MSARRSGREPAAKREAPQSIPSRGFWREAGWIALACLLTVGLTTLIFQPRGVWPLAFVCLVPWALAAWRAERAWLFNWLSFFSGWVFFLLNLWWLWPVTGLGCAALGFYLALYWPLAGWAIRTGRRRGIRVVWTLPVVWVACEYLRAWVMSGFPWLFLSHAFYEQVPLIQISDVTGAYGVTFVAAMVNALLVEAWLYFRPLAGEQRRGRALVTATVATVVVVGGVLGYGFVRLAHEPFEPGPRIAVVQEDFVQRSEPPYTAPNQLTFARYLTLGEAAARARPDLLVFPETAWGSMQNQEFIGIDYNAAPGLLANTWSFGKTCHEAISAFARGDYGPANETLGSYEQMFRQLDESIRRQFALPAELPRLPEHGGPAVTVLLGAMAYEHYPEATYPKSGRFNSALVYDKNGAQRKTRYDKMHLVPFGEYVPFRGGRWHWLYRWLNSLSPFSGPKGEYEYSLMPGTAQTVFDLNYDDRTTRFGTPICYEDVMPYAIRNYVWAGGERRVDFLVNISNDGWFLFSDELPQHLAICTFRAVENRVGIARAVNTGISGFIDPDGRLYGLVEKDGRLRGEGVTGYRVERVLLDHRDSLYGRLGDWFAALCLVLAALLWAEAVIARWVGGAVRRVRVLVRRTGGKR